MKKLKVIILLNLFFVTIGIAAVTTNLSFDINSSIASNPDDFLVYFSDVKVNGVQDLSLVRNEKTLVFSKEFSAVGDKVTIDYDVTNASKNYDATIMISCTESNNHLNVTNNFDTNSYLVARSSRTGVLVVELTNAVSDEKRYDITCSINANALERNTQNSDIVPPDVKRKYFVGEEIIINTEAFNVISDNGDTVTMLAKYNLNVDYQQSSTQYKMTFSDASGWEYTPGPKEVDFLEWSPNFSLFLEKYVYFLKEQTNDTDIEASIITLNQLKELGCTINDDYSKGSNVTCKNSNYLKWLDNGQTWWTVSAVSTNSASLWLFISGGTLGLGACTSSYSIRPLITISKDILENY